MTRKRVFLAALLAVASLGAVAQSPSGTQAPGKNQVSIQQSNTQQPASASTTTGHNSQQAPAVNSKAPAGETGVALTNGQLPQTSTILPLLGLIGLGSLVAGFFSRR
ncbi:MAG TPA: hypothetical protein VJ731_08400 [Terriglobales bacterium]|nr:hypothetical protein [Terriglobales bacterium]